MKTLLLVVCAACSSNAGGPRDHGPPTNHLVEMPRTTPPPKVTWDGQDFKLDGFPAVAKASEIVVLAVLDNPSHANPELHFDVMGRDDKLLQTIEVTKGGNDIPPDLAARVDAANKQLATLHGVHDLQPMHEVEVEGGHDGEDQHWASGDNLDVEWREHHLRVFRHNDHNALVDRDGTAWLAPLRADCSNPAFLGAVAHAPQENVVVVTIRYRGNDSCWEPEPQQHVVTWYQQ